MKNFFNVLLFLFLCIQTVYAENDIAVVDLQKIVNSSEQVKSLKHDHANKMEELNKIIVNARMEISNEKDQGKILLLEEKYTNEFNNKKNLLEKEYMNKLNIIDKNIRDKVVKKAKEQNYKYVFAKSVVLYGGEDITESVIKDFTK